MAAFTDAENRTWVVQINVDVIKRVRALLDVDLLDTVNGRLFEQLAGDPVLLCDVLYAVCKPQADEHGVSDEEFGRAMVGDVIEQATEALLEELANFFPSRTGQILRQALQKMKHLQEMVLDAARARLEGGEIEERLRAEMRSGSLSTSSRQSQESSRDD